MSEPWIELCNYEPYVKDGTTYQKSVPKMLLDVYEELRARLTASAHGGAMDYFKRSFEREDGTLLLSPVFIPADFRWVACYPVTGGSEGHYIHVDLILNDGTTRWPMFAGKTFLGWAKACEIANFCAKELGA